MEEKRKGKQEWLRRGYGFEKKGRHEWKKGIEGLDRNDGREEERRCMTRGSRAAVRGVEVL